MRNLPEFNRPVIARLRRCSAGTELDCEIMRVDEDDVEWRTCDDNSELSYEWDVVSWKYLYSAE